MSSGTTQDLFAVWGLGDVAIAVGAAGTILRYDGTKWSITHSVTTASLRGVWGASLQHVFAVGGGTQSDGPAGTTTVLLYDGANWIHLQDGASGGLTAVWGTSPDQVLAVGYDRAAIYQYDGKQFARKASPWADQRFSHHPTAIWGTASDHVYIVGCTVLGDKTEILGFDGSNLMSAQLTMDGNLGVVTGVSGTSRDDIFLVGATGGLAYFDGTRWSSINLPVALTGVWANKTNMAYVVGKSNTIYRCQGPACDPMASNPGGTLNAVWGNGTRLAIAVGNNGTILHLCTDK